jgi:prepilin-type N-terminal cleavage/methylation domain-containing protein
MNTPGRAGRADRGFTLVELMIVVLIVAILALVAVPVYASHLNAARMAEGIAAVGCIRTALRTYAVANGGCYPDLTEASGDELELVGIAPNDLDGHYFGPGDYLVNSNPVGYTIRATLPSNTTFWYQVDTAGNEIRHAF